MAGATNPTRDGPALLDPEPQTRTGRFGRLNRNDRSSPDDIGSYYRVGRRLLEVAVRTRRIEAASAAVEVFRGATERVTDDAALRNGLGAALLERARLERDTQAVTSLQEAMRAFQAASALAARQATPRAVGLRYEINTAMILWMLGERTQDTKHAGKAVHILQSVANELSKSSAHWSHVQDNLGNALMALGHTAAAIAAYQAALEGHQAAMERGRSLNNLATAYAAQARFAEACQTYRDALSLQPRDQVPLDWARTQHNLASALLQEALASAQPQLVGRQLAQAIEAFEAARGRGKGRDVPPDWGIVTANLAGAYLSLGAHLCAREARPAGRTGARHIRRAIELYKQSLPELTQAEATRTIQNIVVALRMLQKISDHEQAAAEIRDHQAALISLAARHGLEQLVDLISRESDDRPVAAATPRETDVVAGSPLPAGLQWPGETYAQARKAGGEDIVAFLSRVWLPLIEAGVVDLRTLRMKDPSAAKAIDNFTRKIDPVTGQRRRLPPQLHIPTMREINDRLAASIPDAGARPARLDWALRSRARRARERK
jgi:tetratricopeptide (TPR) repeat protein